MFGVGCGLEFSFLFTAEPERLANPLDPVNANLRAICAVQSANSIFAEKWE